MAIFNDELLQKLHFLARLRYQAATSQAMVKELNRMTDWLQELQEVDVTGVEPLYALTQEHNKLRDDIPVAPLSVEQLLRNAPARSSHYFRMPTVKKHDQTTT